MPGVTARQVRRLIQRVRVEGDAGLVHRSRGRPSNRQRAPALKARVLRLYATHDGDVGPTLAVEKLAERHGITLSAETLGGWLRQQGIEHFARGKRPHRAWRARKAHAGALLQMDDVQVRNSLQDFKRLIEDNSFETGAWRGEIHRPADETGR